MGGIKRKISLAMIEKKDSRSVAFSKRRNGLYSKTSELCLLSGAQVAILATPVSSKSNVSFYSFGHSSVDSVVSAFLANQRPREDLGLGFWWEDESLAKSEDTKELSDALNSISSMLQNLKGLHSAAVENREGMKKKKDVVIHGTHQELDRDQTLNLQPTCASICIHDDPPANFEGFIKSSGEEDLVLGNLDGWGQELDLDQIIDFEKNSECLTMNLEMDDVSTNRNSCSGSEAGEDGAMVIYSNSDEDNLHFSALDEDQIVAISDNNNNGFVLGSLDQELDLDQIIDFETNAEGLTMSLEMDDVSTNRNSCSDSVADEDGAMVIHIKSGEDSLQFYALNENQIVATFDNNKNNINALPGDLHGCNQELDLDQVFDFMTSSKGLSMNLEMDDVSMMMKTYQNLCSGSEAVEDETVVFHRDLDEDNLRLSDYFNELTSITTAL